jgi:hypothetical protein
MTPARILACLREHGVEFVVIGGLAAIAHGSRRMTRDIDVVVRPEDENLRRLEAALAALDAVALIGDGRERAIEPADLATIALGTTLHTNSPAGRLDIVGAPAGGAPFEALWRRGEFVSVDGVGVRIAGLDDLIAMKRAAGRPLDLQDIADLTSGEGAGDA